MVHDDDDNDGADGVRDVDGEINFFLYLVSRAYILYWTYAIDRRIELCKKKIVK